MAFSLKTNALSSIAGNIIQNFAQFLLFLLVVRLGDSKAPGLFALSYAICAPIFMFFEFRLHFVQLSDATNKNTLAEYFFLRLLGCFAGLFVVIFLITCFTFPPGAIWPILFIALTKVFESLGEIYTSYAQKNHHTPILCLSKTLRGFLSLALFGGVLFFSQDLSLSCGMLALSSLVIFFLFDKKIPSFLKLNRKIQLNIEELNKKTLSTISHKKIYALFYQCVPLGGVSFLASLSTNTPRYLIEHYLGLEALGAYSGASYIMIANVMFMTSIFQPFISIFANFYQNKEIGKFKKLLHTFLGGSFLYSVLFLSIFYFGGDLLIQLIYGKNLTMDKTFLMVLMLASCFNFVGLYLLYSLTSTGFFGLQLFFYIGDVILMFLCCLCLIPLYGLLGGAISMLIVMVYHITIESIFLSKQLNKQHDK